MRCTSITIIALTLFVAPFFGADAAEKTKILFIAGTPSHAPGDHEHRAGSILLAKKLTENNPNIETEVVTMGWPKDESVFDGVSSVVIYCDGGGGHLLNRNLEKFQAIMDKGVGLVCLHYAVETTPGEKGGKFLEWLGGYFEPHWSVNPHWTADYTELPKHDITQGVKPFEANDEWYYHMRFLPKMAGVTPILSTLPPDSSLSRGDGPHSGNAHVRRAVANGEEQHMAWAFDRSDGGRSFGFTGGHYHRNWADDDIRKLVLNAIAWTANVDVPKKGIESSTPSREEMRANLDKKN